MKATFSKISIFIFHATLGLGFGNSSAPIPFNATPGCTATPCLLTTAYAYRDYISRIPEDRFILRPYVTDNCSPHSNSVPRPLELEKEVGVPDPLIPGKATVEIVERENALYSNGVEQFYQGCRVSVSRPPWAPNLTDNRYFDWSTMSSEECATYCSELMALHTKGTAPGFPAPIGLPPVENIPPAVAIPPTIPMPPAVAIPPTIPMPPAVAIPPTIPMPPAVAIPPTIPMPPAAKTPPTPSIPPTHPIVPVVHPQSPPKGWIEKLGKAVEGVGNKVLPHRSPPVPAPSIIPPNPPGMTEADAISAGIVSKAKGEYCVGRNCVDFANDFLVQCQKTHPKNDCWIAVVYCPDKAHAVNVVRINGRWRAYDVQAQSDEEEKQFTNTGFIGDPFDSVRLSEQSDLACEVMNEPKGCGCSFTKMQNENHYPTTSPAMCTVPEAHSIPKYFDPTLFSCIKCCENNVTFLKTIKNNQGVFRWGSECREECIREFAEQPDLEDQRAESCANYQYVERPFESCQLCCDNGLLQLTDRKNRFKWDWSANCNTACEAKFSPPSHMENRK